MGNGPRWYMTMNTRGTGVWWGVFSASCVYERRGGDILSKVCKRHADLESRHSCDADCRLSVMVPPSVYNKKSDRFKAQIAV